MKAYLSFLLVFGCFVALSQAFCDEQIVVASDGTAYDLGWIMGYQLQVPNEYGDYVINVTICSALNEYCGVEDCSTCGSSPDHGETCFGAYDALTVVEPLDGGLGVLITYNDGANCTGCTGGSTRRTTLKLICNQLLPGGIIQAENTTTISPTDAELIIVGEWYCNYPSAPTDVITPSSPDPVLQIDYYNYYHVCNESLAHTINEVYTTDCEEQCIKTDYYTIYRTCGKRLQIEKKKWVQIVLFGDSECGFTPLSVTYAATDVCHGDIIHQAFDCDDYTVKFLDCKYNPFCRNCEVSYQVSTDSCTSGEGSLMYSCIDPSMKNLIAF